MPDAHDRRGRRRWRRRSTPPRPRTTARTRSRGCDPAGSGSERLDPAGFGSSTPEEKAVTLTLDNGAVVDFGPLLGTISGRVVHGHRRRRHTGRGRARVAGCQRGAVPRGRRHAARRQRSRGRTGASPSSTCGWAVIASPCGPGGDRCRRSGRSGSVDPDTWLTPLDRDRVEPVTTSRRPRSRCTGIAPAAVPAQPEPGAPQRGRHRRSPRPRPRPAGPRTAGRRTAGRRPPSRPLVRLRRRAAAPRPSGRTRPARARWTTRRRYRPATVDQW